jgi:hypothetical protein
MPPELDICDGGTCLMLVDVGTASCLQRLAASSPSMVLVMNWSGLYRRRRTNERLSAVKLLKLLI